jgi:hypothetical protein
MRTQIFFVAFIALFLIAFILLGLPFLKQVRHDKPGLSFGGGSAGNLSERVVPPIDISIEDICLNVVTNDIDAKCLSASGCDQMCKTKGCMLFGLLYNSSSFTDKRCMCNCIETNKIKKALNLD